MIINWTPKINKYATIVVKRILNGIASFLLRCRSSFFVSIGINAYLSKNPSSYILEMPQLFFAAANESRKFAGAKKTQLPFVVLLQTFPYLHFLCLSKKENRESNVRHSSDSFHHSTIEFDVSSCSDMTIGICNVLISFVVRWSLLSLCIRQATVIHIIPLESLWVYHMRSYHYVLIRVMKNICCAFEIVLTFFDEIEEMHLIPFLE